MKIVINACYGGFSISLEAAKWMADHGSEQAKAEVAEHAIKQAWLDHYNAHGEWPSDCPKSESQFLEISAKYGCKATFHGYGYTNGFDGYDRSDPLLVGAIEALGSAANGECANLRIVEVPDDVNWAIDEYDGFEHVEERHRTWS